MNYRFLLFALVLFSAGKLRAQVGINTTAPNAQLEIKSSNEAAPANTDGLIIPKVNAFPAINPTATQQGMMVYLTTTSGSDAPGFYYWDNATVDWKPIAGTSIGTLDQAYDFGGAGNGKTITADAGAVLINGTDGLVSTGISGSGALAPSGGGSKMFWNPRSGSFRAGNAGATSWDQANIGASSVAFGNNTMASGTCASAFGLSSRAIGFFSIAGGYISTSSGDSSIALGHNNTASGEYSTSIGAYNTASGNWASTAIGNGNQASGDSSIALGNGNQASGDSSTAFGIGNIAASYGESVIGIGATTYTPSPGGDLNFQAANATDRLFVIGNAIDANANMLVENSERSDAMIVLKNGLTRLPSTTNAMITAADGKAVVTKEYLQNNAWLLTGNAASGTEFLGTTTNFPLQFRVNNIRSGLLDTQNDNYVLGENALSQAIPGTQTVAIGTNAGLNQQSPASGNVFIGHQTGENNTTGLRNTFLGFRAGRANTVSSNNTIIGFNSGVSSNSSGNSFYGFASGFSNTTGGLNTFIGSSSGDSNTTASLNTFIGALAGTDTTTGSNNTFLGHQAGVANNTGFNNTFIGQLSGDTNLTGSNNSTLGTNADFGVNNLSNATAIGAMARVDANNSMVLGSIAGVNGAASSVNVGIGTSTPQSPLHLHTSTLSHTQLQLTNATTGGLVSDGLLVASAIAGNGEAGIVNQEDANLYLESGINGAQITVGSNGNIGIGTFDSVTLPLDKLHVQGNIRMVDGTQAAGRVLTSDANGRATWQNASSNAWGLVGNTGTNATTNFLGTTDNVDLVYRRNNVLSGRIGTTNTFFGLSSGLVNTGDYNTFIGQGAGSANATGDDNTFIGRLAGANGTLGNDNSYLGYAAGLNNTGNSNLILGAFASQNTTGSFNVFVGNQSAGTNTTGSRNTVLGFNAELGANNLTNATAIGNNSQVDTSNSLVLGSVTGVNGATASVNVGIGTTAPTENLHISGPAGLTTVRIANTSGVGATSNVALDFFRNTAVNTDWRIYNIGPNLTVGNSGDDLATVTDLYQFQGARFMPMNDGTQSLGQAANRWNTVFATNGTINTSDRREKKEIQPLHYGLNQLMQLKPVSFKWNNQQIDNGSKHLGFIAQDLQEVLPEVVVDSEWAEEEGKGRVWKKTPLLGVNYAEVIPVLVQSIQEQQAIIEAQKKEIEQQKSLLETVLQRLTELEKNK